MHKTLVIIPAHNEQENIEKVIVNLKNEATNFDILVVNDGSEDLTGYLARENRVMVADLSNNLGIGGAVQTGYKYALHHNYDIAIQMDGDGQHEPKEIINLIQEMQNEQFDLLIGSRFLGKGEFKSTRIRRIGIAYFSKLIYLLTKQKITDPTSGLRACNKRVITYFTRYYPSDYPEPETILRLVKDGYKIKEIPVVMYKRDKGVSSIKDFRVLYFMVKVSLAILISCLKPKKNNDEGVFDFDNPETTNYFNS